MCGRMASWRGVELTMQPFLQDVKRFIHDLDPPGRLAKMPPGLVVAIGVLLLGVVIAILVWWAAHATRK